MTIVDRVTTRYLELVDERVPALVEGLYLIGSVAYGDFRPSSDIDFVAVTSRRLTSDDRHGVVDVHARLARELERPWFDGHYATAGDLRSHPDELGPVMAVHEGRCGDDRPSVIEWGTLRRSIPVRGAALDDAWTSPDAIREYSRRNLAEYWRDTWLRGQRRGRKRAMSLADSGVHWGVLGIPRLLYSIETGEVISKSQSGEYALSRFEPRWERVIREALRIRRHEGRTSLYRTPLGRRRDALAFQEHAIEVGLRSS